MANSNNHPAAKSHEQITDLQAFSLSPGEIIIGTIQGIDSNGQALVSFSGKAHTAPVSAISTIPVNHQLTGRQVALLFAQGNINSPVIMGVIHSPLDDILENVELSPDAEHHHKNQHSSSTNEDLTIDGKRLVIEGKEEIVLKCGDASITLTKSGKILIRGKYLLNRSAGVNRIMGGSVQVN